MMNWIEQITPFWQQWILLSVPGAIVLYLLAEFIAHYGQNLSPRLRYWLFIGVLVKCIIPPLIWVSVPIITAEPVVFSTPDTYQVNESVIQNQTSVMPSSEVPVMEHQTSSIWQPLSWTKWMFIVQLTGTGFILCFLIYKLGSHIRLRQALRDEDTGALCGRLCIRLNMLMPRLYEAPDGMGACAGGFFSPYILIPKSVLQERYEHQELVIMHELIHVQRMDHIVNWLQVVVFAVFWWHPIIWRMNYLIRCERELCCDERVVQELAIDPVHYSKLLVDAAERQILYNQFQWQTAFANPAHAFQNRIRRIVTMKQLSHTNRWLSVIVIVLFLSGLTVGFQFVQAQNQQDEIDVAILHLDQYKKMLEKLKAGNHNVPQEYLDEIKESVESFDKYFNETYSPNQIIEMTKALVQSQYSPRHISSLDVVIQDGFTVENITLKELTEQIIGKTGIQINLGENVAKKIVSVDKKGSATVGQIIGMALANHELGYTENNDGVIYIDTNDRIFKYPGGSYNITTHAVPFDSSKDDQPLGLKVSNFPIPFNAIIAAYKSDNEEELNRLLDQAIYNLKQERETANLSLTEKDSLAYQKRLEEIFNRPQEDMRKHMLRDVLRAREQLSQSNNNSLSILDTVILGGVVAPGVSLKDVINLLSLNTGYNFEINEGAGEKMCTFSISGNPTVKEVLDGLLPSLHLDYVVLENNIIRIDTPDRIKQFKEESVTKSTVLNKVINGGVVAPGVSLKDVIKILSLNTGNKIVMAEGVGDTMCTLNITGNPTLKEILNAMLPSLGMAYTVTENNVIVIDEKVEQ